MKINYLSFFPATETETIEVYAEKQTDRHPLRLYSDEFQQLKKQHSELTDKECLFYPERIPEEECAGKCYKLKVNLSNHIRLAKHIITTRLYQHFKSVAVVGFDYIGNLEVWVRDNIQQNHAVTRFQRFSLTPKHRELTDGWELRVSFNGYSSVYNQSIAALDLRTKRFKVVVDKEIIKYEDLTPRQKQQITATYPIVNLELKQELHIDEPRKTIRNKYLSTMERLSDFCKRFLLADEEIKNIIRFSSDHFHILPKESISTVASGSNALAFGNSHSGYESHSGILRNGPFQASARKRVRFFFIYQKNQQEVCSRLYDIFSNGLNKPGENKISFPPLSEYIKQQFSTDKNGSIAFTNLDTALEEINDKLNKKVFDNDCLYVALYISPVSKNDVESSHHSIYFRLKEMLLRRGITSQAIYKENPDNKDFNYFLPNIAIAILAKIGGIPWQLESVENSNDLIIGVGAFRSNAIGERYVGSAFCFNNNGLFQYFDCYRDDDLEHLVADIRRAIGHFVTGNKEPERLIIHYYKTMGKRESAPITRMLNSLGFKIPVYVVTINKTETNDVFAYDENLADMMPLSGTIVKIGDNQFLLFNNARYTDNMRFDYLFPVRIRIAKYFDNGSTVDKTVTMKEAEDLLKQVYQFSRMYWKSVKQQNLPVTIKYPEMVAEIVPHFSSGELPPFGKTNLWFL